MTTEERRAHTLSMLRECGSLTIARMQEWYPDVSAMTLRRDLRDLEEKGIAIRTRGGCLYAERDALGMERVYAQRLSENTEEKRIIARKALPLVQTGRSVFLDSGSTVLALSRMLPDTPLSVVTAEPNIALEVARRTSPTVTLLGGQLSHNNLSTSGALAEEWLRRINIDIAFMACSGYSREAGFTGGVAGECDLKRAALRKARRRVMLMDLSKLDRHLPYTFAELGDIHVLITDQPLPPDMAQAVARRGIDVL